LAKFKTNQHDFVSEPNLLHQPFGHIMSVFQPTTFKNHDFQNFTNLGAESQDRLGKPPDLAKFKTTKMIWFMN